MARQLRIEYNGAFYHITSRGNNKADIFFSDTYRRRFLNYINESYKRFLFKIHAYCLMSNHYHLLMETPYAGVSKIMHDINSGYSNYIKARTGRCGHFFQGRPKIILIDKDEYVQELSRYIHLNPVRAGIVKAPEDYEWSSYSYYTCGASGPEYIETALVLSYFGEKETSARKRYMNYVHEGAVENVADPLRAIKMGTFLGNREFIDRIRKLCISCDLNDRELPAIRKLNMIDIIDIKGLIRKCLDDNDPERLRAEIYFIKKYSGLSLKEIGCMFGKNISTVNSAIRRFKLRIEKDMMFNRFAKNIEDSIEKMRKE